MLTHSGFFVFRNPGPDRQIENWFIASSPDHTLTSSWLNKYEQYLTSLRKTHPAYFLAFYKFQWLLKQDNELCELFKSCSGLSAGPTFIMRSVLYGRSEFSELAAHIRNGLPLSKLDWKGGISNSALELVLEKINALKLKRAD